MSTSSLVLISAEEEVKKGYKTLFPTFQRRRRQNFEY